MAWHRDREPKRWATEKPPTCGGFVNGRGGFRTCDLSRVKRALSH
jgi:hypothetical protein